LQRYVLLVLPYPYVPSIIPSALVLLTFRNLEALVEASGHLENGKYTDIVRFTVGVAFLGTPFQGTHQFLYEFTLLRIAAAIDAGEESSQELAKYLQHGSERGTLDELVSKFCQLKDNPHYKFPVVCFFEELRTDFTSFLSRLPPGVAAKLDGQHSAVVRFFHTSRLDAHIDIVFSLSIPVRRFFREYPVRAFPSDTIC